MSRWIFNILIDSRIEIKMKCNLTYGQKFTIRNNLIWFGYCYYYYHYFLQFIKINLANCKFSNKKNMSSKVGKNNCFESLGSLRVLYLEPVLLLNRSLQIRHCNTCKDYFFHKIYRVHNLWLFFFWNKRSSH